PFWAGTSSPPSRRRRPGAQAASLPLHCLYSPRSRGWGERTPTPGATVARRSHGISPLAPAYRTRPRRPRPVPAVAAGLNPDPARRRARPRRLPALAVAAGLDPGPVGTAVDRAARPFPGRRRPLEPPPREAPGRRAGG